MNRHHTRNWKGKLKWINTCHCPNYAESAKLCQTVLVLDRKYSMLSFFHSLRHFILHLLHIRKQVSSIDSFILITTKLILRFSFYFIIFFNLSDSTKCYFLQFIFNTFFVLSDKQVIKLCNLNSFLIFSKIKCISRFNKLYFLYFDYNRCCIKSCPRLALIKYIISMIKYVCIFTFFYSFTSPFSFAYAKKLDFNLFVIIKCLRFFHIKNVFFHQDIINTITSFRTINLFDLELFISEFSWFFSVFEISHLSFTFNIVDSRSKTRPITLSSLSLFVYSFYINNFIQKKINFVCPTIDSKLILSALSTNNVTIFDLSKCFTFFSLSNYKGLFSSPSFSSLYSSEMSTLFNLLAPFCSNLGLDFLLQGLNLSPLICQYLNTLLLKFYDIDGLCYVDDFLLKKKYSVNFIYSMFNQVRLPSDSIGIGKFLIINVSLKIKFTSFRYLGYYIHYHCFGILFVRCYNNSYNINVFSFYSFLPNCFVAQFAPLRCILLSYDCKLNLSSTASCIVIGEQYSALFGN